MRARRCSTERNLKPAYQPEVKLPEDKDEVEQDLRRQGRSRLHDVLRSHSDLRAPGRRPASTLERHVVDVDRRAYRRSAGAHRRPVQGLGGQGRQRPRRAIASPSPSSARSTARPSKAAPPRMCRSSSGSGQFIPGFEDQLIGAKAGDERAVNVTFPETYGVATLAGKAGRVRGEDQGRRGAEGSGDRR